MFRGRKLVLQYTGGSPCGSAVESRSEDELEDDEYPARTLSGKVVDSDDDDDDKKDDDDDEDKPKKPKKPVQTKRRKSTLISFHCEKDPLKTFAVASFIGTDPDECAYFFEMRSEAACPGLGPVQAGLGPGGVFGIIAIIAVLVYFLGGVMYNRSVEHARGWRQLPNYAMWAGIGGFFMVSRPGRGGGGYKGLGAD
jgi:cation-dependent mannose-6-phosphate receptor